MKSKQILAVVLIIAVALIGCSSSSSDSGSTVAGTTTAKVTVGTMTKGSVIVGGVRFEDTAANITADDTPKTAAFLETGMTVRVRGRVNDDGATGTAERIEVVNEVTGSLTSKGTDTLTINGQTVLVDGSTVFDDSIAAGNISGLNAGDHLEVHGQRDAAGVIHATRIELLGAGAVDEVRGVVSGVTGTLALGGSFAIGTLSISTTASTSVVPTGAAIANGTFVQVHLNGTTATKIKVENAAGDDFAAGANDDFEVEGFISGFTAHPGSFKVNNQSVQTSSSTRIEGGVGGDLANDIKVEAEGRLTGGTLIASKISFKESVRIESNATGTGSANMLGKVVNVTSKTEYSNLTGDLAGINAGDGLKIRGYVNTDGSITATRVEKQNTVPSDRHIVQGPVTSKDATAKTLVILGFTINASGATSSDDSVDDSNPHFANIDAFFSAVTAGKTIVKARGSISGTTITANEIEIE